MADEARRVIQYFFPGARPGEDLPALARSRGLGGSIGSPGLRLAATAIDGAGPGGSQGVLVEIDTETRTRFNPNAEWIEGNGFFLSCDPVDSPRPEDLERPTLTSGYSVELLDGCRWIIPTVKLADGGSSLPRVIRLEADGSIAYDTSPRFLDLTTAAERIFEGVRAQFKLTDEVGELPEPPKVDVAFGFKAAALALGVNYYVTEWELSLLRLLDEEKLSLVHLFMIDFVAWIKIQKELIEAAKKNGLASIQDGSITSDGVGD